MMNITLEEIKEAIKGLAICKSSYYKINDSVWLYQVNNAYFLVNLEAKLGEGGFSTVYDAHSVQIDKGKITYGIK